MKNLLEVNQIDKKYGEHTALKNVSIKVPEQSIYGLLGPNGAGKTSLIRIINQIIYPDSGAVFFNGDALHLNHVKEIGYMPEERGLYKSMKIEDQVLYLAQLKGMTKNDAKIQMKSWFEKLGVQDWKNRKIEELSKGMAQKIQFIVTVIHQPKLLIFDEPFSGFDPLNANLIKDEIINLKKQGATIIFSTHRMETVEEMCDNIALINRAQKVLEGNVTEIKRSYKSNTYELGIQPTDKNDFLEKLSQRCKVETDEFYSLNNELKLKIHIDNNTTTTEILSFILQEGTLTHFTEKIPSLKDIFIQAVNQS